MRKTCILPNVNVYDQPIIHDWSAVNSMTKRNYEIRQCVIFSELLSGASSAVNLQLFDRI